MPPIYVRGNKFEFYGINYLIPFLSNGKFLSALLVEEKLLSLLLGRPLGTEFVNPNPKP